ncbi:MAG: UDP-N-acetylmuramoyl-tripeptide--D-alanyl-D-alanine ligase [Cryomorphaceae bacterium]|jgi:UDP-N-acetylmuramoyl-tripeptide--D-alanyl-D-alanine ligase
MMQLSQVSAAVNGELVGEDAILQGVSTNTREDCLGRLFVALKGKNFDAHEFLDQAQAAGAGAVMIERKNSSNSTLPSILVRDTHQALKDLAAWWRAQFVIPLIGVTGSVGKTTVKEMLGAIFAEIGEGVVTKGNLNNEIGVPLTLMRLTESDQYAVIEMGMNRLGEISRITSIAKPTIVIINNAAAAHLEGLGSIDAVAQAKGEILEGLTADGLAVINLDDRYAQQWISLAGKRKVITFGLDSSADVWASYEHNDNSLSIKVHIAGKSSKIELSALGEHSVRNALAATAAAHAAHVPLKTIKRGLQAYRTIAGRMNVEKIGDLTLIDDTYNANPTSMRAAIDVLAKYPNSTLIVADMGELGAAAEAEHRDLGVYARDAGVERLLACGELSNLVCAAFGSEALHFSEQNTLIAYAMEHLCSGTVLVKGSRFTKMERVVLALRNKFQDAHAASLGGH